jgi:hypothetical protein
MAKAKNYTIDGNCIGADEDAINEMEEAAVSVSLATIQRHCVGVSDWAREAGYGRAFPLSKDWAVSYHRSTYKGRRCYYINHSRIFYIWTLRDSRESEVQHEPI